MVSVSCSDCMSSIYDIPSQGNSVSGLRRSLLAVFHSDCISTYIYKKIPFPSHFYQHLLYVALVFVIIVNIPMMRWTLMSFCFTFICWLKILRDFFMYLLVVCSSFVKMYYIYFSMFVYVSMCLCVWMCIYVCMCVYMWAHVCFCRCYVGACVYAGVYYSGHICIEARGKLWAWFLVRWQCLSLPQSSPK